MILNSGIKRYGKGFEPIYGTAMMIKNTKEKTNKPCLVLVIHIHIQTREQGCIYAHWIHHCQVKGVLSR